MVIVAGLIAAGYFFCISAAALLTAATGAALVLGIVCVVMSGLVLLDLAKKAWGYWINGDEEAGNEAIALSIINVVTLGMGKYFGKFLNPLLEKFAGTTLGQSIIGLLDDLGNAIAGRMLAVGYSEEFIQNIVRISGKQVLTATEGLVGELEGMGISRTFIEATGNKLGYEGLVAAKSLLQDGIASELELLTLVNDGYLLQNIRVLADYGILPSQFAQYGISNSLEAIYASKFVKAGYSPEVIEQLASYGFKPSSYLSRGLTTPELAEAVTEAIELIPVQYRQMAIRAFKDALKARTLTSDIIVYRHWGGIAEETGSSWYSLERFSPTEARAKLALPDGNTAVNVTSFTIPTGTKVVQGEAANMIGETGFGDYAVG